ncbi:hypothetical protein ANANG_G00240780 [Anguilla anguilla]|uniref:Uncharacterized protein n=1 Tax=Anguilla anguilla TaxID=7936 RepID=A0A9D3LV57_ANGAN|nr:hypothetical protein ANANG_G00240780 [Anguilla anguilla]
MISCIGCFWVLLSSALVAICSYSFATPAWIVKDPLRNEATVSFGLLWHCSESTDHMYSCYSFAGLGKFAEIPSVSWQASVVLCCGGCVLLAVSSMLAFITVFLPSGACERRACVLAGYVQMVSVLLHGADISLKRKTTFTRLAHAPPPDGPSPCRQGCRACAAGTGPGCPGGAAGTSGGAHCPTLSESELSELGLLQVHSAGLQVSTGGVWPGPWA